MWSKIWVPIQKMITWPSNNLEDGSYGIFLMNCSLFCVNIYFHFDLWLPARLFLTCQILKLIVFILNITKIYIYISFR